ncbi:MAG: hypothetical protein KDA32_03250, partial [Phycisphaerales bacterium]|nr:hypothetical protein [Phycisphaerales bacterium]
MTIETQVESSLSLPRWPQRIRFVAAIALIYAGLHYVVGWFLPDRGPSAARTLLGGWAPLAWIALFLFAKLGEAVAGEGKRFRGMLALLTALGLWAFFGGTMDAWLIEQNVDPSKPYSGPYLALMIDYLALFLIIAMSFDLGHRPLDKLLRDQQGWLAMLVEVVVAGLAIWFLMGPRNQGTYHGQVIFAVGVGFWLATQASMYVCPDQKPFHRLLGPVALGILGLLWAVASPAPAPPYDHLNNIPAQNLVRPLPIEMVAVGM